MISTSTFVRTLILTAAVTVVGTFAAMRRSVDATTVAPPPTFPPPQFNGYIMLAQYNCDTFECTEWELDVTRLATECFIFDCQYEQAVQLVIDPEAPTAKRDFTVLTAAHHESRTFYTAGLDKSQTAAAATLWVATVDDRMNSTTLQKKLTLHFPTSRSVLVALEAHPVSGKPMPIFQNGDVGVVDLDTGKTHVIGNFLHNFTRMSTQVTTVDANTSLLYSYTTDIFGSEGRFVTFDLSTLTVKYNVPMPWLQWQQYELQPFQLSWVPAVNSLILFSTGKFDQLIYVDPATGNASWAIYNMMEDHHLGFQNDPSTRSVDLLRTNTYDSFTQTLYFQASQYSSDGFATTALASYPFSTGAPQPIPWLNINLEPLNFGYQGYHYFHCRNGTCPT